MKSWKQWLAEAETIGMDQDIKQMTPAVSAAMMDANKKGMDPLKAGREAALKAAGSDPNKLQKVGKFMPNSPEHMVKK